MPSDRVPAAQYLRMSTEHQRYSLENQAAVAEQYAEAHGFSIVLSYADSAKSGLVLKHRAALRQLLQDVVSGEPTYRAILVYDVSRWGRFQDTDESAHYEFLCKSAGVPVHYCAESFMNDGTIPSLIMKTLKRAMAAEYSRELGVKVLEGQKRLAHLGFKQGGVPGYGLRRLLVSEGRSPKQELAAGERKSIATDRVVLVPGPPEEVKCVREIYRMLIRDKRTVYSIARELNRREVKYRDGSEWDYLAVFNVLTHPKYSGCHVFGRTSQKLCTKVVRLPKSQWVLTPSAFDPIVDQATFDKAQRILRDRTINKSNEELLGGLRKLLARRGRLSLEIIKNAASAPSPSVYRGRFGSLRRAYELIGYGKPADFGRIDLRRRTQALRNGLMEQITNLFPGRVSIMRRGGRWRSRLHVQDGGTVSVLIARPVVVWKQTVRWQIDPVSHERNLVTLVARLNVNNESFKDFFILPSVDKQARFGISLRDSWLERGERLSSLTQFCELVRRAPVREAAL